MEEILITKPKLPVSVKCPKCESQFITGAAKINVFCNKCNKEFISQAEPSILTVYAARIQQRLADVNELRLKTKPFFQKDLFVLRELYKKQKCWDLTEIELIDSYDEKRYCNKCGICKSCKECLQCGNHLRLDEKKCKCGSKLFKSTYINNYKDACPHCKNTEMIFTVINNKTKCPRCKTDDITPKRKIKVYSFIIKRLKPFMIDVED